MLRPSYPVFALPCSAPTNQPQVHRQFRKPLIVFSPKNLLRHAKCRSRLAEFDDVPLDEGIVGTRFKVGLGF
jgi:hypothetical protein